MQRRIRAAGPDEFDTPQSRGRPALPDEVARRERVVTFLTLREKESLSLLASAQSMSLSAVCHRLIVKGLRQEEKDNSNPKPPGEGK